jgi:hypothetical protein
MGAESSVTSNIYALNECLDNIEKRLFYIEDQYLHHEATLLTDNSLIISGKRIDCSHTCHLTIGPILGTIGSTFARLMIETDCDAEITLNVFVKDNIHLKDRFAFSKSLPTKAMIPTVVNLDGLQSETIYIVYIGGISADQCLKRNLTFETINKTKSNLHILIHNPKQFSTSDYQLWLQQFGQSFQHESNYGCHQLVVLGNVLQLQQVVNAKIHSILNVSYLGDNWINDLNELEMLIAREYRHFLERISSHDILRRISWIIIGGNEESLRTIITIYKESFERIAFAKVNQIGAASSARETAVSKVNNNNSSQKQKSRAEETSLKLDQVIEDDYTHINQKNLAFNTQQLEFTVSLCSAILRVARYLQFYLIYAT